MENYINLVDKYKNYLELRPGLKLFQKAFSYLAGERIIRMALGFFVHTLVVRYLGPSDYGIYGYAVSFFAIFQPFINYGAEDIYLKDILDKEKKLETSKILGSGLVFKLISATFSYIAIIGTLFLLDIKDWQTISLILILGIYNFFNSFSIFEVFLQSKMDFKSISYSRLIGYLVSSAFKIAIVHFKLPMIYLAGTFVIEIIIARLLVYGKVKSEVKTLNVSMDYMKNFFILTWPYLVTVVVISLAQKSGVFFLKEYSSIEQVGIFTVMLTLTRFIDFIPMAILTSIIPKIIETKDRDYGQYLYRLSAIYAVMCIFVLALFCFFYLFSGFIVKLFYGDEFSALASLLPWGILSTLTTYINLSKARHCLLESMTKEWLIFNIGSLICILILQYYLVPRYGVYGALAAYSGGYMIFDFLYALVDRKFRGVYFILLRSPLFPFKFIMKRLG